jgi:sulfur oxidation c-type cytochrome SoxX
MQAVLAIFSGTIVGLSLGMIGGGGSMLALPLLLYVVGVVDPHAAIGTSATAVAATAFFNLWPHARAGHVRWRMAVIFATAGICGALVGSAIGKAVNGQRLLTLFAVLMMIVAYLMQHERKPSSRGAIESDASGVARLVAVGFPTGGLAGFFGIGGGFLIVPGLILAARLPIGGCDWLVSRLGRCVRVDDSGELCAVGFRAMADRSGISYRRNRRRLGWRHDGPSSRGHAQGAQSRVRWFAADRCPLHVVPQSVRRAMSRAGFVVAILLGSIGLAVDSARAEQAIIVRDHDLVPYDVVDSRSIPKPLTNVPGDPARGRLVVIARSGGNCLSCHHLPIPDQPDHGEIGADLAEAGRSWSEGELRLRIVNPKIIDPATVMPAFYRVDGLWRVAKAYAGKPILQAQQVEDVVAYLTTLR